MEQLKYISEIVKHLLETEPQTRNNDGLLYVRVCEYFNPSIACFPFGVVMANQKQYDLPPAESVRRARAKLQAKNEHLRACETVQKYRTENETKYKAYALDKEVI